MFTVTFCEIIFEAAYVAHALEAVVVTLVGEEPATETARLAVFGALALEFAPGAVNHEYLLT